MTKAPNQKAQAPKATTSITSVAPKSTPKDPYLRAANEDDDGYDPSSDRPAAPEPLFERDPWS